MSGRTFFTIIILILVLIIGSAYFFLGSTTTWGFWNIPVINPSFIDLRILTSAAESYDQGFDPYQSNPSHPYNRPLNLPPIWLLLIYSRLTQEHTDLLALILVVLFIIGLILFPGSINRKTAIILAAASISPTVLLAIERGNVDLLIFFLAALSLVRIETTTWINFVLTISAILLKVFPVFSVIHWLDEPQKSFIRKVSVALMIFALYIVITWDRFLMVFSNTEKGAYISYGVGTLAHYAWQMTGSQIISAIFWLLALIILMVVIFITLYQANRVKPAVTPTNQRNFIAFRLGTGIYLGTFLTGTNWDYRLIFLLFTLPQLVEWAFDQKDESIPSARLTLISIFVSMTFLWIVLPGQIFPLWSIATFIFDEMANWFVFFGLLSLLLMSSPDWIRGEIHRFFIRWAGDKASDN